MDLETGQSFFRRTEERLKTPGKKKKHTAVPRHGVFRPCGYRTENAVEKQCSLKQRENGLEKKEEAKKKEKLKETSLGEDVRIPRPIYHKLSGLWRESIRILPEGARKMRIAVPRERAVPDKNISARKKKKKGNIEEEKGEREIRLVDEGERKDAGESRRENEGIEQWN
ncbi:hypothetical protein K0M31_016047 [Melipona bicolor]|uniref:Uncharacterized protein n=1 Tax=Melipona bicolor TaxID=60889 RepID=A0AA40G7L3_9HYME|nr:hypothetical protein K0M31_016047 [Melipona bicolor]